MFWIVIGVVTVAATAFILRSLSGRPAAEAAPGTGDGFEEIAVYRAQLAELERDVEAGLVSEADAAASRLEIERRLLQADERRRQASPDDDGSRAAPSAGSPRARQAAMIAVVLTPVAAGGLYLALGHPDKLTSGDAASRSAAVPGQAPAGALPAGEQAASLDVLAGRLEERLERTPEDAQGWGLLGRTYTIMGEYPKAADAYRKAVTLQPGSVDWQAGLGESLALGAQGQVTAEAREAFRRARALDPGNPAARFYLGMADYQRGRLKEALEAWAALAKDAPADAPWLNDLRGQITAVSDQLGVDKDDYLPKTAPSAAGASGPAGGGDMAALAQRLEADPKDYEGWMQLARMRAAAGDGAGAGAALDAGRAAYVSAPFVLQMFDRTAAELGLDGPDGAEERRGPSSADVAAASQMSPEDREAMIDGMVSGLAARLEENPDDPEGWRMLARSYRVLGETEKSAEALRRLTEVRPDDVAARSEYAQALMLLGKAEQSQGNPAEAKAHFRRAVDLLPENAPLRSEAESLLNAGTE